MHRGYSLGWDNVQKGVHRKHQTSTDSSEFMLQATCYAIGHRTPSLSLDDKESVQCQDIDPSTFIPSAADWLDVRERMIGTITNILTKYVPALKTLHRQNIHTDHDHSDEMSNKRYVEYT